MKLKAGPIEVEASEKDINAVGENALTIGGIIALSGGVAGFLVGCPTGVCGTMMVGGGIGIATGSALKCSQKAKVERLRQAYNIA